MALIEEVWGTLTPSSPPAPRKTTQHSKSKPEPEPVAEPKPDIAAPTTQPIQESFQSMPSSKHQNLTLFLAIMVTGICSIYAVDMFAETIRRT